VRRLEEERAEQVDDGDQGAVASLDHGQPAAGRVAWKFAGRTIFDDERGTARSPRAASVVAEGERVGSGGEQPLGEARRDPDAVLRRSRR
jgi:hypothetical protein